MRFITAVSFLAATAFAGHYESAGEKSYAQGWAEGLQAPPAVAPVAAPVMHTPVEAAPVAHPTQAPAMVHPPAQAAPVVVHTPAPVVHTPPPAVHTVMAPPVHAAPPAAAPVHVTSSAKWEASMVAPAAGAATHTVIVGGDAGLVYTPEHIQANIGDIVHFVFHKQNHSVTQSTFDNPCVKKAGTEFDSGLLPNPNNTVVPAPTWQYTVTEKEPTWWYCKQRTGSHCGKGMVFAINPTAEKTFNVFKEVAIKINGTNTATPAAPPAATAPATTVTLDAGAGGSTPPAVATPSPAPVQAPPALATMAPGWNAGTGGQCNCACFCGAAAYPKEGQGSGSFGGLSGMLPSPWQPEGAKARRGIAMKA